MFGGWQFVLQGLGLGLVAVLVGAAISAIWVAPVLIWRSRKVGWSGMKGLVWLSAPWLIMHPIGLAAAFVNQPPAGFALFTSYVAMGIILTMPLLTLAVAIGGVFAFKGRRGPAFAVGLGNVVIALCCSLSELPVYTLARGGV